MGRSWAWARLCALLCALIVTALVLPQGCAAGDLGDALAHGSCSADEKCAAGYSCNLVTNQCEKPDASQECGGCGENQTCCDGKCVDTSSSAEHCGGCFQPCDCTTCVAGACTSECQLGCLDCDDDGSCETSVAADPNNCGACNAVCTPPVGGTASCADGVCGGECPAPTKACDAVCLDVSTDPENCGQCGAVCAPVDNGASLCAAGKCAVECDQTNQFSACGDACVNFKTSPFHCGGCDVTCDTGLVCRQGGCAASCSPADGGPDVLTQCGASCVDTQSDVEHCGGCDQKCPRPLHATPTCTAGVCGIVCGTGFSACGTECVDTDTDPLHCGGCDKPCAETANGTAVCVGGSCSTVCSTGFKLCNGQCVDPATDAQHCGGCGNACAEVEACSGGVCVSQCTSGLLQCGSNCVDTQTDPVNCGQCGKVCLTLDPNAIPTCAAGQCSYQCKLDFTDCAGKCVNLSSSPTSCGSCGTVCPAPLGGSAGCSGGTCTQSCPPGLSACNGVCVNTQTSGAHCGGCNNPCGTGQVCSNGACVTNCPSGTELCAGGCVNTSVDIKHCGGCGIVCPDEPNSSPKCSGGVCGFSCDPTWSDCVPSAPGCETQTANNPLHCGACNRPCSGTNVETRNCSAGKCNSFCKLGFLNPYYPPPPGTDNGCESGYSMSQCGGLGTACYAPLQCTGPQSPLWTCVCAKDADCGPLGSCSGGSCTCQLSPEGPSLACNRGEVCATVYGGSANGFNTPCSCGGLAGCSGSLTCCPAGAGVSCHNLFVEKLNCGACGRVCPVGFQCIGGQCECSPTVLGVCTGGTCEKVGSESVCKCGNTVCAPGQRCLPNGQCG